MKWWVYVGIATFAVVLFFPLVRSWFRKPRSLKPRSRKPSPSQVKVSVTPVGFTVEEVSRKSIFQPTRPFFLLEEKYPDGSDGVTYTSETRLLGPGFSIEELSRKTTAAVDWSSLTRIAVIKTDTGPWQDELFYHITHSDGELTIPSQADNADAFLTHLKALPGFKPDAFAAIAKLSQNNSFVVIYATQ